MNGQTVVLFDGTTLGSVVKERELDKWMSAFTFGKPTKVRILGKSNRLQPMNGGPERTFSQVGTGFSSLSALRGPTVIVRYIHQSGEHRLALVPQKLVSEA